MVRIYRGEPQGEAVRVAIVVARYNETITGKLCDGALTTLAAKGVAEDAVEVAWVPGAWELPVIAARFARSGQFHAVICLGAVIKGETTHDQYINSQVSSTLGQLALECEMPIMFGVLTCNTLEQALHRAGGNVGNKGSEAAEAALEMVHLMKQLPREE
ncbi:6,7-dimethyl-8-ribityllumazine synthase [Blastopirellula sp. J2-11]|uniref:6,7-dimethyl-8-ribityllumazine synthase n=1 Tax=Blastopirellula sp. J2-11 TaxID=2943192 RepID=UPI0021C63FDA|nr:6,7-dimethyl-8-ribityllumazine synthase [Blastopirellula sp. J2-11]UUO08217.1 6,7-dimethyl-8-ribityllumazine synthase [Blastopirellula sp. J2-11]